MKGERKTMTTKPLTRQATAVLLVVALGIVGVIVATATASHDSAQRTVGHRHGSRVAIGVFSHRPKGLAHVARTGSLAPPAGAILAAVVGKTEIYALHNNKNEDCVIELTANAGGGSVCALSKTVEEEGIVGIGFKGEGATAPGSEPTLRVAAMVPNGVTSVTVTDRDGSSYVVPVINNVVDREDIHAATVSYRLPGGGSQTTNVATMVDHIPTQPGPPGSSK